MKGANLFAKPETPAERVTALEAKAAELSQLAGHGARSGEAAHIVSSGDETFRSSSLT